MFARVSGLEEISSTSKNESGAITLKFNKHTDIDKARLNVSAIIRQSWSDLPKGLTYPTIHMRSADDDDHESFITYTINAPSNPFEIKKYADEHIKNELSSLKGIYKIIVSGANPMEWRLKYDSNQLSQLGITLDEVKKAISCYCQKTFLGFGKVSKVDNGRSYLPLVVDNTSINKKKDSFNPSLISVKSNNGKIITLDQLVSVTHCEQSPKSFYRINGLNSVYLSIYANKEANQLQLAKDINEKVAQIQSALPSGFELYKAYDSTQYIQKELNKIYLRAAATVLFLLLLVLLISRSAKYLFLIIASLVTTITVSTIFYYIFDLEIQLYSLAGITVSLNLVIDNIIVMTDHYVRTKNRKTFLAILAATLTTIGALSIVFFLDEQIRLCLQDFSMVIAINLIVSLAVAFFFVPALIDAIRLSSQRRFNKRRLNEKRWISKFFAVRKRLPVYFSYVYRTIIRWLCKWKIAVFFLFLLLFGLPVFLLPEKIESDSFFSTMYNKTLGSERYITYVKPKVDNWLGGTLGLFVNHVDLIDLNQKEKETVLHVKATLPKGNTIERMNTIIERLEFSLKKYRGIEIFQTNITDANNAQIDIYFTEEAKKSDFPFTLYGKLIHEVIHLGESKWMMYGLPVKPFSNNLAGGLGSYVVACYGYNYDELLDYAQELRADLLASKRVKEVQLKSKYVRFGLQVDEYNYKFNLDKEKIIMRGLTPYSLFSSFAPSYGGESYAGNVPSSLGNEQIKLVSNLYNNKDDIWNVNNFPLGKEDKITKMNNVSLLYKEKGDQAICKINQQYRVFLVYDFIGMNKKGRLFLKEKLDKFNKKVPMGYLAKSYSGYSWKTQKGSKSLLLLLVIAIVFIITSILFNSFKQPLAIIFSIPVSYIGVFLTFYLFDLVFDQGCFASFILLCGITVNASIYLINEYNNIRKQKPNLSPLLAYTKAFNTKIIPIFLTVVSTILGFVPFMLGEHQHFWFGLSAGTIGGLAMSLIGLFFFLPIMVIKRSEVNR